MPAMTRPRSRGSFARLASVLTAAVLLAACGGGRPERVNVLLISLDSTRRDLLGAYGYRAPHAPEAQSSPHLDRLAAQGVLLEEAYATTSWTFPSHVSILTGQPEVVHAVDVDFHRPDPARPMLAEILREAGYRTAGFFSGPYLEPHFGFDRGFERYEACYGPRLSQASRESREAAEQLSLAEQSGSEAAVREARAADVRAKQRVELESHRDVSSLSVSEAVLTELHRARTTGQPFFVFAHFFDPHYDYVPPAPYGEQLDPHYEGTVDGRDFYSSPAISVPDPERPGKRVQVASQRDLEHVRSLYAAELAWTDAQIGTLLDELERLELAESTLVVVLADHGDEFFEHGGIGHRSTLYEELVRIPLLLRLPGVLPAGRRVPGLVSTIDVLPTVLQLAGVAPPEGLVSRSFLPLVLGEPEAGERAVLGRIVASRRTSLSVPEKDDPDGAVPGLLVTLLETYRRGPIKVTREREWTRPIASVSPRTARALAEDSRKLRAHESLRWIDLEAFPDEREQDHSSDFGDPRAHAALRAFHDLYVQLLALRGHADLGEEDPGHEAALGALGYTEALDRSSGVRSDEFTLPPPGAALLSGAPGR